MENTVQLGENFPINAYLSYRCKNQLDIDARDKLKNLCQEQNITLRYDQNETKPGDSLIEFMEDLTAARCIFLFLSPEYFQSAYTLFELVSINERADLNQRFILPLRLTESMVTYQWTAAKDYFEGNKAVRNELARLLKVENDNHAAIWQRVDAAWETIVFKHLDKLNVSLENANTDIALGELLSKTKTEVNQAIHDSTETLHKTLIAKITAILKRKNINADEQLGDELALTDNNDSANIATQLVTETKVRNAISILIRVLEEKKSVIDTNSMEWKTCVNDTIDICGWLLLNSVDSIWWFHNEIKLRKTAKTSITGNYVLQDPNYVEVVISRDLPQSARFKLDKNNQPRPASEKHDVSLFDASSPQAKKDELLVRIYKDLYGVFPSAEIDILSKIVIRAQNRFETNKGKVIYYLVSRDYITLLQSTDWFVNAQSQLAGCLQFICCDEPAEPNAPKASNEDQTKLLNLVADLLLFKN